MTQRAQILAVQRALGIPADGIPGPQTWTAIHAALIPPLPADPSVAPPLRPSAPDERSMRNISTLHPAVVPVALRFLEQLNAQLPAGVLARIISGTRTYEEQDALFQKRPKVTNARGGYSNHNFGIAWDIGLFRGPDYLEESDLYDRVGTVARELGLEWGGDWKSLVDKPHVQMRPPWAAGIAESAMLLELRRRKASGKDYFA